MSRNSPAFVVADTHLGLLPGRRFLFFRTNGLSDSVAVADCLAWLQNLSEKSVALPRGDWGKPLELVKPSYLILLGDYFELWDASDAAIEISGHTIWNHMEKLDCKKVHIIGNHDFAYERVEGRFPQGKSSIQVVTGTFPAKNEWLEIGGNWFVFLHGHQFDWGFYYLGGTYEVLSFLRDGAEGLGLWSWALLFFGLVLSCLGLLIGEDLMIAIAASLLIVAGIPRLIVTAARPLWNHFFKSKYDAQKALEGFAGWWKRTRGKAAIPSGQKYIVFGHTHLMDVYTSKEIEDSTGAKLPEDLTLVNIPSWVSDISEEYQKIFRDAFLYVNGDAHLIGWDWKASKPFYIPQPVARTIAIGSPLDEETVTKLAAIGWPPELLEKLRQPFELLASKNPFTQTRKSVPLAE
jgi:UDP-2,3-diacylglucosamine pyrophosphatase LpxH